MFTGIVEATGTVDAFEPRGGDWRLAVSSRTMGFEDVAAGDSIAVSGVCLTVIEVSPRQFRADVSNETVRCTTLADMKTGDPVNLEKALLPTTRMGGHIVSGHVDGVAVLLDRAGEGRSERLVFRVPEDLSRYIAPKGSVCVDGVSLTVNEVKGGEFSVNIIPHTAERTTFHLYRPGRRVNLEVDVVSRYLERLFGGEAAEKESGLTFDKLAKNGFINSQ